jgi:hypothetical protein
VSVRVSLRQTSVMPTFTASARKDGVVRK